MNGPIKFAQARPPEAKELALTSTELFVMCVNRAFGKFPIEFNADHIERLEGMAAMSWGQSSSNPYDVLIRAIKRYGTIYVWQDHAPSPDTVRAILEAAAGEKE